MSRYSFTLLSDYREIEIKDSKTGEIVLVGIPTNLTDAEWLATLQALDDNEIAEYFESN